METKDVTHFDANCVLGGTDKKDKKKVWEQEKEYNVFRLLFCSEKIDNEDKTNQILPKTSCSLKNFAFKVQILLRADLSAKNAFSQKQVLYN